LCFRFGIWVIYRDKVVGLCAFFVRLLHLVYTSTFFIETIELLLRKGFWSNSKPGLMGRIDKFHKYCIDHNRLYTA
jgi:hypothetical protein